MSNFFRVLTILTVLFCTLSSCEDYLERGIEGRWQLLEIKSLDTGTSSRVDTVFYSFDRDVFQYLKLTTPTESFEAFGMYKQDGDKLRIWVDKKTFKPWDCFTCFDWESTERIFTVKYHSSSRLILDWEGQEFIFRKF